MTDPGGKYYTAIQDQLNTPGGRWQSLGVNVGQSVENIGNILLGGMSGQPDRPQLAAPPFGSGNVPWGFEAQTKFDQAVEKHKVNLDREEEIQKQWKEIFNAN